MNADLFLPGTIRKALSEKSTRSFGSSTTNNWWLISRMFLRSAGGREARDLKTVWSKSHSFRRASQQGLPGGGKHACKRLRQWLCAKHKVLWPGTKRFP